MCFILDDKYKDKITEVKDQAVKVYQAEAKADHSRKLKESTSMAVIKIRQSFVDKERSTIGGKISYFVNDVMQGNAPLFSNRKTL